MSPLYTLPAKIRWLLFTVFFVLLILSGWRMLSMPLWGYWPMALLLGFWGCLLLIIFPKIVKTQTDLTHLGLSTLSAVLLWLGFPDMPFTPLLFVAFIPLLIIEDVQQLRYGKRSLLRIAFYSFHAFFLWNVLSTFWVANTAFFAGIFANVVNAGLMVIPMLAYHWLRRCSKDRFRWASLVVFWMMFEFNHLHWELTWPFLSLGNALGQYPSWAQWYSYTGILGGTIWFLGGNALLYPIGLAWFKKEPVPSGPIVRGVTWFIVPLIISLVQFYTYEPQGQEVEVAVVQPNFEPHYEKFEVPDEAQLQRFLTLSREVLNAETKYLVFPETSFGGFDYARLEEQPEVIALRALLDSFPNCALITGIDAYRFLKPGEDSPAKRAHTQAGSDTLWWEAANMAIQLSSGQPAQQYLKGKLVPGAECTPYRWFFFFMEPLVDQLGGSLEGLRRSEERSVFEHKNTRVAPVICYESVFGDYCNGYVQKGAQALAIITNDGWWDDTPGHRQHLMIGSLRAIESRREIIRSANTGISGIIDQRGIIRNATEYEETTSFRDKVRMNDSITPYVIWGDFLGRVGGLTAVIFILLGLYLSIKRWLEK